MGNEIDSARPEQNSFAIAKESPADRQEIESAVDDDISQILNGNKSISGKAVWSANGAAAMQREDANLQKSEAQQEARNREAEELAHLAAWNAELTNIGGVAMTNAEAQEARQHIIDHEDEYAERAVREGRIREDEKEEYKRAAQRIRELKEREGRGTATDAEKKECERLQHSRIGKETENDAGKYYAEEKSYKANIEENAIQAKSAIRPEHTTAMDDTLFKSAPALDEHFDNAKAATVPLDKRDTAIPPSQKLVASNFSP